jgi:hypothetical protein
MNVLTDGRTDRQTDGHDKGTRSFSRLCKRVKKIKIEIKNKETEKLKQREKKERKDIDARLF